MALALGTPGQASTVLAPSATTVDLGDSFSIELDDASFDPTILGVDVDVTFDPTVLKWDSVSLGSWVAGGTVMFNPVPGGDVSICCFNTGVGDSVFTAFFTVLSTANPGPNPIPTTISFATDPVADPVLGYQVNPNPSSVTVEVTPESMVVPEPTTGTLLLIGVVGAMTAGRMLRLAPGRLS